MFVYMSMVYNNNKSCSNNPIKSRVAKGWKIPETFQKIQKSPENHGMFPKIDANLIESQ